MHVPPPDARAVPRPRGRAQDQAHPALRAGAAADRHPAGHGHVPLRGAAVARHPGEDRPVREPPGRLGGLRARRRLHLQGAPLLPRRGRRRPGARALRHRDRGAGPVGLGDRWSSATTPRATSCGSAWSASTPSSRTPTCRSSRRWATAARTTGARSRCAGSTPSSSPTTRRSASWRSATASSSPAASACAGSRARSAPPSTRARTACPTWASAWACRSRWPTSRATWRAWTAPTPRSSTPRPPIPVVDLLPEQKEVRDMGGTMRLGADPVKLHDGTRAREVYGEPVIYERHRHRYEVNNHLRRRLEAAGLVCSGTSPDDRLVEVDRAARPPVLRRVAVPPRVQVAPAAPAAAVPRLRGRGAGTGPRPRARGRARTSRGTGERADRPVDAEARA